MMMLMKKNDNMIFPLVLLLSMLIAIATAYPGHYDGFQPWSCPAGECCCNGNLQVIPGEGLAGECKTFYPKSANGQQWCFVDRNANCPDKQPSMKVPGRYWSFLGCKAFEIDI
jgi:hypothetical protein